MRGTRGDRAPRIGARHQVQETAGLEPGGPSPQGPNCLVQQQGWGGRGGWRGLGAGGAGEGWGELAHPRGCLLQASRSPL